MVPIVQVSRECASILLCEYYQCLTVAISWHLCYSRVRVCIKGTLNLSLDILRWVCLRLVRGSNTGSHTCQPTITCKYYQCQNTWQPVTSVVGLRASWLPQSAPCVNPWCLVNNTNVLPCNRVDPVVSWGALSFDTGGGGWPVLIIVVPTSVHKRVKSAKK